jgi:prepilin-type N-terminal cleavage/methylation domain-containing protein
MTSRGFTLIELLIAITLTAVVATALTRILLSDSRFVSQQDAMITARQTARAAQNVLAVELRMVADSGLLAAAPDSVRVRIPYAFGIACGVDGSDRLAVLMPTDSLMYVTAVPDGLMRRLQNGNYQLSNVTSVSTSTNLAPCTAENINLVPGGTLIAIQPSGVAQEGEIFFLYQTISYRFSASTELPGRIGLWRRVNAGAYEELVAPFDSTARFRFLIGANHQPADVAPANLATVAGLELKLVTQSYVIPQGKSTYETFDLPIQIAFMNRMN